MTVPLVSDPAARPRIGVLAMQGAFAEHVRAFAECGAEAFELRTVAELGGAHGVVIPGGESTAIRKALDRCGLFDPLRDAIAQGLPAFGTCAGMIVLAVTAPDGAPACFGVLDVGVERNGYGRQVHSAERMVLIDGEPMDAVFIRAPRITRVGEGVAVIGRLDDATGEPVVVQQQAVLAASFHPELTDDRTLHRRFVAMVRERSGTRMSGILARE